MSENQYQFNSFTSGIEVVVRPNFAKDLSSPSMHKYVYIYRVKIINDTQDDIKLLSREWNIVEEDGTSSYIQGEGVLGKTPVIKSGEDFEYTSQAILYRPSGIMYGTYKCVNQNSLEYIELTIPAFSLDVIQCLSALDYPN